MKVADVLEEMRSLLHTRGDLLRRIERAKAEATACGALLTEAPRGTGTQSRVERAGLELADLTRELAQVEDELTVYRRKVAPLIERMPVGTARVLMRLRYVDWNSVAEVADRAGYSRQNAYRALRSAENGVASGDATT